MGQSQNTADPADRFMIRSALTGTGDGDSLQNLNTVKLPDGAAVYVLLDKSIWVLDKTSTATPVANEIIAPGSGPGRWLRFGTVGAGAGPAMVTNTAAGFNSFVVDGTWVQPNTALVQLDAASDESCWALTASGCILTYTGPTRRFSVSLDVAAVVSNAAAPRNVFLGVSHQNDLTGTPVTNTSGEINEVIAVADSAQSLSTTRLVTMATGQTLRPKMAAPAAAVSLGAIIRMVVAPAG